MNPLYLVLAPAGIGFLVLASWLAGGWRSAGMTDLDAALRRLCEDEYDYAPADGVLSADGRSAIFVNAADEIAVVFAVGLDLATRILRPGSVARVQLADPAPDGTRRLTLRLRDFTDPAFRIVLPADADAEGWRARLASLAATGERMVTA